MNTNVGPGETRGPVTSGVRRVALVSCDEARDIDYDMDEVRRALLAIGVDATVVSWDDPAADWASFDRAVLRSTWDYHRRVDEFLSWARRVAALTRLSNGIDIVEWNTDKHYLAEIARAGFAVVPTTYVEVGDDARSAVEHLLASGDVVVKPCVSAGSNDTERHGRVDDAMRQIDTLLAGGRSVMLQPYMARVDVDDETGLVYLNGEYSHAFAKGPLLAAAKNMEGGLYAEERIEARVASAEQRALGDALVAWVTRRFGPPLYARVDLLPTDDGPVLVELEMTEPSLYVALGPGAADRFARAITSA